MRTKKFVGTLIIRSLTADAIVRRARQARHLGGHLSRAVIAALLVLVFAPTAHGYWDDDFEREWREVQACTGLAVKKRPTVIFEEAILCPTSDNLCLASRGYFPCPFDEAVMCGATASLQGRKIILPYGRREKFKHEAIHYLLRRLTGDPDGQHTSPLFVCELL